MGDERSTEAFEWITRGDPSARHALVALSPEGKVLAASATAAQWATAIFGRPLRAGDDVRALITGEDARELDRDLRRAFRGEPVWLVRELAGPAGSMWLEIDYHPLRTRDGAALDAVLLLIAQVSGDRLSAAIVRQAERRFRDILSEAGLPSVTVGRDCAIDYCNDAFAALIGVPRGELLNVPLPKFLVSEADRERVERLARGEATSEGRSFDALLRTAGGELREVTWNMALRREPGAPHVGIALVCHDNTARHQASARIAAAQRMAAIGKLAATAAHEINNPLALLQTNAVYLKEQLEALRASGVLPASERLDDWIAALNESLTGVTRIRDIVANLGAFARAVPAPEVADVHLKQELMAAVALVEPALRERARLELDVPEALPALRCEPGALTRAFVQLLTNAAQAIPEGNAAANRVSVVARLRDQHVEVDVTDTGVGIAPELHGRIFEPFFTTKGSVAGLGLSITRTILDACGGTVGVTSAPGQGATFHVQLPLPSAAPQKPRRRRTPRVLVLDDEPMIGRAITRMLSPQYEVFAVTSAADAFAELSVHTFDAVLCDLGLPDITGVEFRRKLEETVPSLLSRLVFITGGVYTTDEQRFAEREDILVLSKPLDATELRETLTRLAPPAA